MATFNTTTTDRQDAAAQWKTDKYNAQQPVGTPPVAVLTFVRQHIFHFLNSWADEMDASSEVSRFQAYRLLTPEEKITVDTILDSHR